MFNVVCEFCGKSISKCNYSKHLKRHSENPQSFIKVSLYKLNHSGLNCQYCNKLCKNKNSLCNHERLCKQNPNRQESFFKSYNSEHSAWNKGLTKYTDERVAKNGQKIKKFYEEHPEKITGGNKPGIRKSRYKYGTYHGFYCDSSWELAFVIYCLDKNLPIERNDNFFIYTDKLGKQQKFYPDFIINNIYYEIKGGYDQNTAEKVRDFPKNKSLVLINKAGIQKYLNYAVKKFGKTFYDQYDKDKPAWFNEKLNKPL